MAEPCPAWRSWTATVTTCRGTAAAVDAGSPARGRAPTARRYEGGAAGVVGGALPSMVQLAPDRVRGETATVVDASGPARGRAPTVQQYECGVVGGSLRSMAQLARSHVQGDGDSRRLEQPSSRSSADSAAIQGRGSSAEPCPAWRSWTATVATCRETVTAVDAGSPARLCQRTSANSAAVRGRG